MLQLTKNEDAVIIFTKFTALAESAGSGNVSCVVSRVKIVSIELALHVRALAVLLLLGRLVVYF